MSEGKTVGLGPTSMVVRTGVMVAAAFLLSTLVAPWGWYRLHWFAYLPFFWALREETPRANRWLVLLYGTLAEALIFSWIPTTITLFSNIPGPVAWAIGLLFSLVFGSPYFFALAWVHDIRKRLGDLWILALPAWLVVVEYVAIQTMLFPYNQGVSQYREPWVFQIVSVTGLWGVSYLMLFFNACFAEAIYRRREGRELPARWMGSALAVVALVVGFGAWRYAQVEAVLAEAPVKRFHQVQSDHTMLYRLSNPQSVTFGFWMDVTKDLEPGSADVLVWPEGASPYDLNESNATQMMWDIVDAKEVDFVVGSGTREREADPTMGERGRIRVFNSVYFFARERREIPEPWHTLQGDLDTLLADGCDLEHAGLYTAAEAYGLRVAAEARGDDAAACAAALGEAEAVFRAGTKVTTAFLDAVSSDPKAWAQLRHYTAELARPLKETWYYERNRIARWRLSDAACNDGDCQFVSARCQREGCTVYPSAPHYDKMVPLPFGEYLPLAETFPFLADIIQGPGNFRAGTEAMVFRGDGIRMAAPICYEGILGYVCDQFVDADVLVNVTNDAWFGPTAASDLHGMLVTVRATELGKPVFRSTYSGVGYVVEPHGRIYAETPLFEVVKRTVPVRVGRVDTVYAALGDWFVMLCFVGVVSAGVASRRRRDDET